MFARRPPRPHKLDVVIDDIIAKMTNEDYDSKETAAAVDQLSKLYALKEKDISRRTVSPDTLLIVGANILGIVIIVAHERVNVITTKAIGFVARLK